MIYSRAYLKRMDVARAIAHRSDDLVKVSKQVLNMTQRNHWLTPEAHPTEAGVHAYRPGDCVTAAVVLRLWNAGFGAGGVFDSAVLRLETWYLTDEFPDWQEGDPDPVSEVHPNKPYSPACYILQDFCETNLGWTLQVDHRRHAVTGAHRTVASLWRGDGEDREALGNGAPLKPGEVPQSTHLIVLDEILAQVASSTVFNKLKVQ